LPKSWFGKQARAHQARVIHSLARAAHAACYLGIGNKPIQIAPLLSEKFTEPGDHKMCCKAPDYSEWLKAMIKKIKSRRKCADGKLSSCPRQGRGYFESFFSPTCSHSTIRLVLALTSVPGWNSLDLDAVCAFISSDLAEGERVYMKGPGYDIVDGNCLSMLKCIHDLVQAPRQDYLLCREAYQKSGMKQLQTDECVFTRHVSNIIGSASLTNEDLLVNSKFFNMELLPMQMRVYRSCSHPVAAMILVKYVDNNAIRYNWS